MNADAALVAAVRAIMERDAVDYAEATRRLRREQPRLYEAWEDHLFQALTPGAKE